MREYINREGIIKEMDAERAKEEGFIKLPEGFNVEEIKFYEAILRDDLGSVIKKVPFDSEPTKNEQIYILVLHNAYTVEVEEKILFKNNCYDPKADPFYRIRNKKKWGRFEVGRKLIYDLDD